MDILPSRLFLVISCFLIMGVPAYENFQVLNTHTQPNIYAETGNAHMEDNKFQDTMIEIIA
jgi:hypothetical protein